VKFDNGGLLWRSVDKIQIWLQSGSLREDLSMFIVAGDIKSPLKRCIRLKLYQAVSTAEYVGTLYDRTLLLTLYVRCLSWKL
jgi:hypothetical protein